MPTSLPAATSAALFASLVMASATIAAGGWSVVPVPGTSTNAVFYGASARTDSDVWAVGVAFGGAGSAPPPPIAYHSNGSVWSRVPTPSLSEVAGLVAVSASSAGDAWAVGFSRASGYRGRNSLFEHWNGSTWSIVGGSNAGGIAGVVALGLGNAWANSDRGVIEHWDGHAWTVVGTPQPNPSNTFGNHAVALSASSPSDIWVVGRYTTPAYSDEAYSLHYDGTAWTVVPMAQPASGGLTLGAVTALGPGDAWAVGQTGTEPVAEHWNGKTWNLVTTVPNIQYPALRAVAARSANDIWAIGSQITVDNQSALLLLHWNGVRWNTAAGPTASSADIYAAATTRGGPHVWAFGVGSPSQPLVLVHP